MRKEYGKSIADRLRAVEDPKLRMDLYLKALQEYTWVSSGTRRKWRKIALEPARVIRDGKTVLVSTVQN